MFKKIIINTKKPEGFWGKIMIFLMNVGHSPLSEWGLRYLKVSPRYHVLDIGCGGGKNISRLLHMIPEGTVYGADYSPLSVQESKRRSWKAIQQGRCDIVTANVSKLPFAENMFDIVTAFETVYFWPDFVNDLREVRRVLKPGGKMLICNEAMHIEGQPMEHANLVKLLKMKIHSPESLTQALTDAGFNNIMVHTRKKTEWICVIAEKI